jgi:predicted 2-oxoglutarate/Fe(II)-dependent dioxygenase YbiX
MKIYEQPFRHVRCFDFLLPVEFWELVKCLSHLEWEIYDKGSYKYKVSSIDYETECYKNNKSIIEKFIAAEFINSLSDLLEIKFERCKDFTFHKMEVGDYSFKHTDRNGRGELARVVYYLTEPDFYEGGSLNLYDFSGNKVSEVLRMPVNSFLSFRMTDKFYHEVETVTKGVRYCISITYC